MIIGADARLVDTLQRLRRSSLGLVPFLVALVTGLALVVESFVPVTSLDIGFEVVFFSTLARLLDAPRVEECGGTLHVLRAMLVHCSCNPKAPSSVHVDNGFGPATTNLLLSAYRVFDVGALFGHCATFAEIHCVPASVIYVVVPGGTGTLSVVAGGVG